ncbi:hypothetical protein M378DRAFT_804371 [Amanita muscaria Koide BX008]|uniref:Uncharacterized protein n=1 Tax=Amanita muscaria (strain Koide BX008) TaxID=946122 RepID=A0A0C2WCX5_AMAMK|nr:hypothetical protein M378DRAFT_804371 [Amanita muscaria Koide BX008]
MIRWLRMLDRSLGLWRLARLLLEGGKEGRRTRALSTTINIVIGIAKSSRKTEDEGAIIGTRRKQQAEERFRLPLSDDDAHDALSDGSGARTQSPIPCESDLEHQIHEGDLSNTSISSISYSMMPIQVGDRLEHVLVWEDEESSDNDFSDEKQEKRELWDAMVGRWE